MSSFMIHVLRPPEVASAGIYLKGKSEQSENITEDQSFITSNVHNKQKTKMCNL